MITLVLGGNKSGKSAYALDALRAAPGPRLMVATGKAMDLAFRDQIMDHKRERPATLAMREVDTDLQAALVQAKKEFGSVLVDSLDFWIFSCFNKNLHKEKTADLVALLSDWTGPKLFLVSCEIGLGPLSADSETRRFARALGAMNQDVARSADNVYLVAAGLPLQLKKG